MSQAGTVAVLPARMYSCVRGNADDYFLDLWQVDNIWIAPAS